MDFVTIAKLSTQLSKEYAEDFFRLLVNYQDISASEAASRLGLHIRTAQDFLDGLAELDIVEKAEAHEKKRPYFRYTLKTNKISLELNLDQFEKLDHQNGLARLVRERPDAGANFSLARSGDHFSFVTVWEGEQRERKERRISLTFAQGKFLYHLPFPNAKPLTIIEIMAKAGVEQAYASEIQDIVDELIQLGVVEVV